MLDAAGSYTLGLSATGGLSGPPSASFTVNPAAADHLAFGVQPSAATAGAAISPAVQVQILDAYGNLLTGDNSDRVTLSVAGGPEEVLRSIAEPELHRSQQNAGIRKGAGPTTTI